MLMAFLTSITANISRAFDELTLSCLWWSGARPRSILSTSLRSFSGISPAVCMVRMRVYGEL